MKIAVLPQVPEYGLLVIEWDRHMFGSPGWAQDDIDGFAAAISELQRGIPHEKWCAIAVSAGAGAIVFGPDEGFVDRVKAILNRSDVQTYDA